MLAEDSEGNRSDWVSYTVNMSPNPPTVLLTATPSSIGSGQSSTLEWSSSNANSCTGTNFSTSDETSGTVAVSPTETTTYTVTCFGAGDQEDSDSAEVAYACTPTYSCSGQNVINNCTGAVVQSCSYQCGTGACILPPPPTFNPDAESDTTGHLQVRPSFIRRGGTTRVYWNVSNVSSCSVSGGADNWTGASSGEGGRTSSPLLQRTTFTLSCTGFDESTVEESATVNILPVFQEA